MSAERAHPRSKPRGNTHDPHRHSSANPPQPPSRSSPSPSPQHGYHTAATVSARDYPSPNHSRSEASSSNNGPGGNSETRATYWKPHLFLLQENAPRPQHIPCMSPTERRPPYYGDEFHGLIDREAANALLVQAGEGSYLVRESGRAPGTYTLCMRFNNQTLNYKLYFDGKHYVGEKRFDQMDDLVHDGLINMYMDLHAKDYIVKMTDEAVYEESPYSQYQRRLAKEKLKKKEVSRANGQSPPDTPDGKSQRTRHPSQNSVNSLSSVCEFPGGYLLPKKPHRFAVHTWKIPHYCDYCMNYLWGLVQQGSKCEDCGFAAHKKCVEKTLQDCCPDIKYVKRMFAVDLTTLCMAHRCTVPIVVKQCIAEIELRGINIEGIYRISGSHDEIEKIRCQYDTDPSRVDISSAKVEDIHTVAGLLKLYLRLLPQPLITFGAFRSLTSVLRTRSDYDRIKAFQNVLRELPTAHQSTTGLLMTHLWRVAAAHAQNRMSVENLARIFAPTLFCAASPSLTALAVPQNEQFILQFLIVNCQKLFPLPA